MVESPILSKDPHEQLFQGAAKQQLISQQQQQEDQPPFGSTTTQLEDQPFMQSTTTQFTPQLQTLESVDRQMTQAFNQPLPTQQPILTETIMPQEEELQKQVLAPSSMNVASSSSSKTLPTATIPPSEAVVSEQVSSSSSGNIREYPCMKAVLTCNSCLQQDDPAEQMLVFVDKYPRPIRLKSDEILVRMKCASVNDLDYKICKGKIPCEIQNLPVNYPLICGADGCGIIEKLGGDPTNLRVGDCVFGFTNQLGTFGEYAVFKEKEVIMKPDWLSCEMASCIPFSALVAMNCFILVDKKRKKKHGLVGPSPTALVRATTSLVRSTIGTGTGTKVGENAVEEEFEKKVIESSQSHPKLVHENEPINLEVVNQLLNGDKLGSILIQGGDTYIGSWSILLARYYFGAQRIYATVNSMDNEEYVRKLGADVIVNSSDTKYEETIERDLAQYWEAFCRELDPQKHQQQQPTVESAATATTTQPTMTTEQQQQPLVTTTGSSSSDAIVAGDTMAAATTTQPQQTYYTTTTETVQEQVGFGATGTGGTTGSSQPQQQHQTSSFKPSMMHHQGETTTTPNVVSTSPRHASPTTTTTTTVHPITQWPHPAFKSKKEMEKCKLLISTIQLSIDTVGGHDNMQKSFNLLNGSTSNYITTNPPIEFEQKKVSGKDVWKLVSMAAANRLKSFFANYPHFHLLPAVQCERELLVELIKWMEQLDREWIQRLLPFKTYPMNETALAVADCKKYPFKLVINVDNE